MPADGGTVEVVIKASTVGLQRGLTQAEGALRKAVPGMIRAAKLIGTAFVTALAASTFEAAKFEEQMSKVGSLLGDQEKTILPRFAKRIQEISLATGQATQTLAAGLFDVVSAGVDAADAMEIVEASARLAVGGFTTTEFATKALITTLQTFKGEMRDAADAADFLFAIQEGGRLTVQEVSSQLGKFAATGKAAGISANELGAAFSILSLSGEGAEIAATNLRSILVAVQKRMDRLVKVSAGYGLELDRNLIKTKGLIPFLAQFKDLTGEQRAKLFEETTALQALNLILGDLELTQDRLNIVTDRAGKSIDAYNRRQKEAFVLGSRVWELTKAAGRTLGNELLPIIKKIFQKILDKKETILTWAKNIGAEIAGWVKRLQEFIKELGGLRLVIKTAFGGVAGAILGGIIGAVALGPLGLILGALLGGGAGAVAGSGAGGGPIARGAAGPAAPGQPPIDLPAGILEDIRVAAPRPDAKPDAPSEFAKAWKKAFDEVFKGANQLTEQIAAFMKGFVDTLSASFQDLFVGLADGTASLGEIMENIGKRFRNFAFKMIADILAKEIAAIIFGSTVKTAANVAEGVQLTLLGQLKVFVANLGIPVVGIVIGLAAAAAVVGIMAGFGAFAKGGIVDRPTLALIGEAGPEAVIPLGSQEGMRRLGGGGGGGGDIHIHLEGTLIEGDSTKWDSIVRRHILPALDRHGRKTSETRRRRFV